MGIRDTLAGVLDRILGFLPNLFAALVILAVGLLIAWGLAQLTRRLMHAFGADRFLARHDIAPRADSRRASQIAGRVVYWVVALVTFVTAATRCACPGSRAGSPSCSATCRTCSPRA